MSDEIPDKAPAYIPPDQLGQVLEKTLLAMGLRNFLVIAEHPTQDTIGPADGGNRIWIVGALEIARRRIIDEQIKEPDINEDD